MLLVRAWGSLCRSLTDFRLSCTLRTCAKSPRAFVRSYDFGAIELLVEGGSRRGRLMRALINAHRHLQGAPALLFAIQQEC